MPSILIHIFSPESRKVGFGYQVFGWATYGAFFAHGTGPGLHLLDASTWLLCVSIAGALIGGGTIADAYHDREMAKITGGKSDATAA